MFVCARSHVRRCCVGAKANTGGLPCLFSTITPTASEPGLRGSPAQAFSSCESAMLLLGSSLCPQLPGLQHPPSICVDIGSLNSGLHSCVANSSH